MKENSLEILKTLTETPGVSGFEGPIRKVLREYLAPLASEVTADHLGSLIAVKKGTADEPKLMIAAHMDEVGFMITRITEEGFLKFQPLGGWWEQVLLAQRVEILTSAGRVVGVIGAKSPHILTPEERKQPVPLRSMYIDVGSTSKAETEQAGIRQGDPVIPYSSFMLCPNSKTVMAKALDDRAGCALIVELFRELQDGEHPNTVYGVMTVQEEVGLRGATTSVDVVRPDLAIVVDVTVATDTPGIGDNDVATRTYLGRGPVIGFYDASMIPHAPFRDFVVGTARENNIPYQVEVMAGGGTDAGKIHLFRQGVPSVVIGIPVRYIHDHAGMAHLDDYRNALELIFNLVRRISAETIEKMLENL
ncbi:MAG TPA: M42 family metallopeptidase [Syntrophomonadaceae bacterium]|nr:M42 family metallopeptidase [Syntrophomonadaceae bacterium]